MKQNNFKYIKNKTSHHNKINNRQEKNIKNNQKKNQNKKKKYNQQLKQQIKQIKNKTSKLKQQQNNYLKQHIQKIQKQNKQLQESLIENYTTNYLFSTDNQPNIDIFLHKKFSQFKQKQKNKYLIAKKIPNHVKQFTSSDIKSNNFSNKNSTILRILTKWAESLQDIFKNPQKIFQNRVYKLKDINHELIQPNKYLKNRLIQRLKNIYDKDVKQKLQNQVQKISVYQSQLIFSSQCQNTYCSRRFNSVRKTSSQINQILMQLMIKKVEILIQYLLKAGHKIAIDNRNDNQLVESNCILKNIDLVVFRIGDLMRSKWTCNQNSFINLVERLIKLDNDPKMKDKFKLIRIKNKLDTKDSNILINYLFLGKIQCQLQLSIQQPDHKSKNYYNFCHFIYELTRGQFGTIAQLAVIISQYDPIISSYNEDIYKPKIISHKKPKDIMKQNKQNTQNNKQNIFHCYQCKELIINQKIIFFNENKRYTLCTNCSLNIKCASTSQVTDKLKQMLGNEYQNQFTQIKQYYQLLQFKQKGDYFLKLNKKQGKLKLVYLKYHQRQLKYYFIQFDNQSYPCNKQNFNYKNLSYYDITDKIRSKSKSSQYIFRINNIKQLIKKQKYKALFKQLNIKRQNIKDQYLQQYLNTFEQFRIQKIIVKQYQNKSQYLYTSNDKIKFKVLCNIIRYKKQCMQKIPHQINNINYKNEYQLIYLPYRQNKSEIKNFFKQFYGQSCYFEVKQLKYFQQQFINIQYINLSRSQMQRCIQISKFQLVKIIDLSFTKIKQLDQSFSQNKNLQNLNLSYCSSLFSIDTLNNLPNLQNLNLTRCPFLANFEVLNKLPNLQILNLTGCYKLLNVEALKNLTNLQSLNLAFCDKLTNIEQIGNLYHLQYLNLSNCYKITNIEALNNLPCLQILYLSKCSSLSNLNTLNNLQSIKYLDLSYCSSIINIQALKNLVNLQNLNLSVCQKLINIEALNNLCHLQSLNLSRCSSLTNFEALKSLYSLQTLDLSYCSSLTNINILQDLSNLQSLVLSVCKNLIDIKTLINLSHLKSFQLFNCQSLVNFDPLNYLINIQKLNISQSESLTTFKLQNLVNLQSLNASRCSSLTSITLNNLHLLQILDLYKCSSLTTIQLSNLGHLQNLILQNCSKLPTISLNNLPNLTKINLSKCSSLVTFNLKSLYRLQEINLSKCSNLIDIEALQSMNNLQRLQLQNCSSLSNINALNNLVNLQSLNLQNCSSLISINSIKNLVNLKNLNLSECSLLQSGQQIQNLTELKILNLKNCNKINNINFMKNLTNIKKLSLAGCTLLSSLQPLSHISYLQCCYLQKCTSLTNLSGLQNIEKIEYLSLSWCQNLKSFGVKLSFQQINTLYLTDCNIDSLEGLPYQCKINLLMINNSPYLNKQTISDKWRQIKSINDWIGRYY